MSKFSSDKLKVSYKNEVGIKEFILPRKYTLTHSDETAELFLTIGTEYDVDSIDCSMRDEVLGKWVKNDEYVLLLSVELDNEGELVNVIKRDAIFRKELPLAIKAIIFGDNLFLENNQELYESDIIVRFNSKIKEYDCVENWGKVKDYKYFNNRDDQNVEKYYSYDMTPFPILPPIQNPYYSKYAKNKKAQTFNIIEKALILMLDQYISREVYSSFGKVPYCLNKAEILEAQVVNTYGPCSQEYEITIGLKVGKKQPFYNNMIITFLVEEKGVKVKSVKNPRNDE